MRVLVSGAGGFVGAHVDAELARHGHVAVDLPDGAPPAERLDAVIHLSPNRIRRVLDVAYHRGARVFAFCSTLGADPRSIRPQLATRGRAEESVRASGLPWVILRPEILWGPGDIFTNELAHLLRHLPFVPVPRRSRLLAPAFVGDAARALVAVLDRPDLWRREWALVGPEELSYAEVIERVAQAIELGHRRHVKVPAWSVRLGAALEERLARRPRVTRALVDRLVTGVPAAERHAETVLQLHRRPMTVSALEQYLSGDRPPSEQMAMISPAR